MRFLRRHPTAETESTNGSTVDLRDQIVEHVAARSEEELELELANYDFERRSTLTEIVTLHSEDPVLAVRVAVAAGCRIASLQCVHERDTEWVVGYANALPDDDTRAEEIDRIIKEKVGELEPTSANVYRVEGLIDAMPFDSDELREEYVDTIATWQTVDAGILLDFTSRIENRDMRDKARMIAVKVYTSKRQDATTREAKGLIDGISDKKIADEAWVSAAKHFATHGVIETIELRNFIGAGRTKAVRTEAMEKVAIRYFFNGGVDSLVQLIDSYESSERPKLRNLAAAAILGSEENHTNKNGYRTDCRQVPIDKISEQLTPKTELVGLIDTAKANA